jgi:transcriptional regulator with XRE-family HTH domain
MSPGEKSLGELVRELRERQGLTQGQRAERALGVPSKTLIEPEQ